MPFGKPIPMNTQSCVRKTIKELRSYNGPFEYARKVAYAVMHGTSK